MSGSEEALEELRSALAKRGNVRLLNLLAAAEGKLGKGVAIERRRRHQRVTYERLSPEDYWPDGSMRCPYQDVPGDAACDYHQYSGCNFDPSEAP